MVIAPPNQADGAVYVGDDMHIDYLTIPGATIDMLTNAFRVEYAT